MNEELNATENQSDPAFIKAVEAEVFGTIADLSVMEWWLLRRVLQSR